MAEVLRKVAGESPDMFSLYLKFIAYTERKRYMLLIFCNALLAETQKPLKKEETLLWHCIN
jgi:hypothetical protein